MEGSSTMKKTRVPSFSGARKDFQIWWVRFKAYANVQKFQAALRIGGETVLPQRDDEVFDESTTPGKEKVAAKMRNAKAMSNLSTAFAAESLIGMIYKSQSTEWPEGLAQ
jgi:peptidyl-tRNA hydrolase